MSTEHPARRAENRLNKREPAALGATAAGRASARRHGSERVSALPAPWEPSFGPCFGPLRWTRRPGTYPSGPPPRARQGARPCACPREGGGGAAASREGGPASDGRAGARVAHHRDLRRWRVAATEPRRDPGQPDTGAIAENIRRQYEGNRRRAGG